MTDQNKQLNNCEGCENNETHLCYSKYEKDLISKCCGAKILLPTMDGLPYWNCSACGKAVILETPCTKSNYEGEEKKCELPGCADMTCKTHSLPTKELDWKEELKIEFVKACFDPKLAMCTKGEFADWWLSRIESLLALQEKKAIASRDEQWKQVIEEIGSNPPMRICRRLWTQTRN